MKFRAFKTVILSLATCALYSALVIGCNETPDAAQTSATPNPAGLPDNPPPPVAVWNTIAKIKPDEKAPSAETKALLGKDTELAGFIIVNDASFEELTDFMVTPIASGCIHVPPPPPNYVVKVVLSPAVKTQYIPGAVLMAGKFELPPKNSKDRKYYSLIFYADQIGPYKPKAN